MVSDDAVNGNSARDQASSGGRNLGWMVMAHTVLAAQVLLIGVVLLVPQEFLKSHAHQFYLIHYVLFLPLYFASRDRCAFLFSPSFLIVSYVSASFIIGGFAFSKGYVLSSKDFSNFLRWNHFGSATAYFMSCDLAAMVAYFLARRKTRAPERGRMGRSPGSYAPQLTVGAILLLAFSLMHVGLGFLGGSGDFSIGPRVFGFLVVCIALIKARWRYRFPVYIGLLLLIAASEFGDRRVVLLLGLSVIFMEAAHLPDLRLSLRRVLMCAVVFALLVVLQMTMTIARGLGGFEGPYWKTFRHLEDFAALDNAVAYGLKQTEGPTTFFHSNNAIQYVLDDDSLLSYGSTLAKTFFVVVPRSVWRAKPKSMVDLYTSRWNPAFRRVGGSTGINVYAEYFWNFHVFGVLCVVPIFFCLNRAFLFYLSRLRSGNVWQYIYVGVGYDSLLMYARGHGLHSLTIDVTMAFVLQVVFFLPLVSMLRATRHRESPLRSSLFAGATAD